MPLCTHCLSNQAEITNNTCGSLCPSCFCDIIERRVMKEVRKYHPFRPHETVLVVNDESPQARVTLELLPKIVGGLPLHIDQWNGNAHTIPDSLQQSHNKILIPLDGDDTAIQFINWLLKRQEPLTKTQAPNTISIVSCLTHAEVETYALAKHLPFISAPPSSTHTSLQGLESRYPGLTHGLLKGASAFQVAHEAGEINVTSEANSACIILEETHARTSNVNHM